MPNETDGSNPVDPSQQPPAADEATARIVNAAVTSHIKRFQEKLLKEQLPQLLAESFKPFQEKLTALSQPKAEEEEPKKKEKGNLEVAALQARLADMEKRAEQEVEARKAAERRARDEKAQSELRSALQTHVKPELLELLSDHLYHRKAVVDFEEDGTPVFKSKKIDIFGAEEEVRLPLKAGIEQFLKSPEAKPFLPSPGTSSAPPTRKPQVPGASRETDISKMSEQEKIAYAMNIEARLQNNR